MTASRRTGTLSGAPPFCFLHLSTMFFLFLLAGLTAGFFAGMFGIGGGAIVIPILVHVYRDAGMDMTEAIRLAFGTSLATMAFTGLSSYLSHRQRGNVDGAWLRKLMLPSGLGALVGGIIAARIPGGWLALGLALMLGYFGIKLLVQRSDAVVTWPWLERYRHVAGFLSGLTYSLAGMGGASVVTFYLTKAGLSLRSAIGTATGVILPISVGAILGFGLTAGAPDDWRWGYIDLRALLALSVCSVVASKLGVKTAVCLPVAVLRKGFGFFMFVLAGKTLLGTLS
ncbi:sulfite exporter TauE/SafE family protein [Ralstonia solanacearum]|uniref:sulfite exporter TauE/SafE family protein n=1 Tax=Ralstonia solanacearum TaxID=305 RepID=UPI0018D1DE70|nr:sulfite exporter TauE/SafE family protein [Ralstonia solanacearum]